MTVIAVVGDGAEGVAEALREAGLDARAAASPVDAEGAAGLVFVVDGRGPDTAEAWADAVRGRAVAVAVAAASSAAASSAAAAAPARTLMADLLGRGGVVHPEPIPLDAPAREAASFARLAAALAPPPPFPLPVPRPFHIAHLNVLATDLDRSYAFYRDVFGAEYQFHLGPTKMVTEIDGFEFFLEQCDDFAVNDLFHFGFRTTAAGVFAFGRHLEELGVPMVPGNNPGPGPMVGPDGARVALYLRDPDGWLIEVYAPERQVLDSDLLARDPRWTAAAAPAALHPVAP